MIDKTSLVRFRNKANPLHAMTVEDVRKDGEKRELKVNGTWWPESCFMSDDEWLYQLKTGTRA